MAALNDYVTSFTLSTHSRLPNPSPPPPSSSRQPGVLPFLGYALLLPLPSNRNLGIVQWFKLEAHGQWLFPLAGPKVPGSIYALAEVQQFDINQHLLIQ